MAGAVVGAVESTAAQLLEACQAARQGESREIRCPAHDDQRESLSVGPGKDHPVLLHCHAGCSTEEVLKSVGLTWRDVCKERPRGKRSEIVEAYDYRDEHGKLLYQVVRLEPKSFLQRRPTGAGAWAWGVKGIRKVLYRLPEVSEEARDLGRVYLVEGEKDADALAALGLVATTAAGGAGKAWQDSYTQALRRAHVVVIPDNDRPGRAHAVQVCASLHAAGVDVTLLELPGLPPKGDASDWLAAGGAREQLEQLASTAGPWRPSAIADSQGDIAALLCGPVECAAVEGDSPEAEAEPAAPVAESLGDAGLKGTFTPLATVRLSDVEEEAITWLWEPYLPAGELTLLGGEGGVGKSTLVSALVVGITNGAVLERIAGREGPEREPRSVVLLSAEDSPSKVLRPRLRRMGADLGRVHLIEGPVTLKEAVRIGEVLERTGAALLVIDPLQSYLGAKVDLHRVNEVRPVLDLLCAVAARLDCAVLAICHWTKGETSRAVHRIQGSADLVNRSRSVLLAGMVQGRRVLVHGKCNLGPLGPSLGYELGGPEGFCWTGVSELTAADLQAGDPQKRTKLLGAVAWLKETLGGGPVLSRELEAQAEAAGHTFSTLRRAKDEAGAWSKKVGRAWWTGLPGQVLEAGQGLSQDYSPGILSKDAQPAQIPGQMSAFEAKAPNSETEGRLEALQNAHWYEHLAPGDSHD